MTSGLGGLHEAMAQGRLDGYRAGVVAFELEIAPADVADAVIAALHPHLGDDAARLRQRARVLLSRISPDLVRERAERARAGTGLRRWVGEPGVDEWHGTFPSEEAAVAWAAIDRLAHDLVAAGACTNIEQARGKALTDLVTGNANVDVQVLLTVPADATPPQATPRPGAAVSADGPAGLAADQRSVETVARPADVESELRGNRVTEAERHDSDHAVIPVDVAGSVFDPSTAKPKKSDDDLVEVQGARPSEPLLVRRAWLLDHLPKPPPRSRRGRAKPPSTFVPCDPLTGARLDLHDHLATAGYRPGAELIALVQARDGRCRFPGCSVAARFCDLDHVRPWPIGRTAARNLLTLCRRHHRIKQRPGWLVRLAPDGTATWTDPTGQVRTTTPLDALHTLVLGADSTVEGLRSGAEALTPAPVAGTVGAQPPTWSALESHLTLRLEHHSAGPHLTHTAGHIDFDVDLDVPVHRRCTSAAQFREAHRRSRPAFPDEPPF